MCGKICATWRDQWRTSIALVYTLLWRMPAGLPFCISGGGLHLPSAEKVISVAWASSSALIVTAQVLFTSMPMRACAHEEAQQR